LHSVRDSFLRQGGFRLRFVAPSRIEE
jgi:hypothetical protein